MPASVHADWESMAFGVNGYGGSGQCDAEPLQWSDEAADAWHDQMLDAVYGPDYDVSEDDYNGEVDPEDFMDSQADETSPTGADWADVVFFNGHRTHVCSSQWSYSVLLTGDDVGVDCNVTFGTNSNEVLLGSGGSGSDANMWFLHASESLKWCIVEDGAIFEIDGGGSGTQFTLLAGFHNSPANEPANEGEVEIYIRDSVWNQVGENFIYTFANNDGDPDYECTSMVITSSSLANANNLFFYGGLKDFKDTGTHNTHWYYSNCGNTCGDNDACG